jgi:hypothetical protein
MNSHIFPIHLTMKAITLNQGPLILEQERCWLRGHRSCGKIGRGRRRKTIPPDRLADNALPNRVQRLERFHQHHYLAHPQVKAMPEVNALHPLLLRKDNLRANPRQHQSTRIPRPSHQRTKGSRQVGMAVEAEYIPSALCELLILPQLPII